MRKLCTNEVGGVKRKKNEKKKNSFRNLRKRIFLTDFFLAAHLAFAFENWFVELEKALL